MTTESISRWYARVAAENILFLGTVIPIVGLLLGVVTIIPGLGITNFLLPFRKRTSRDLPASIAAASFEFATITFPDLLSLFISIVYSILDTIQTPGGLKIDEDAIDVWRANLKEKEWDVTISFYGWNWWNFTVFTNENICDNEDGIYKFPDLLMDIYVTGLTLVLTILLVKNFKGISGIVGGMFGKQMTRRRRKGMKTLAKENLDTSRSVREEVVKLLIAERSDTRKMKNLLEDEIADDVETILSQTKHKSLRL